MKLFLQFLLPLISFALLGYTLVRNIKRITLKSGFMLLLECTALVLLNWSANIILKSFSLIGLVLALVSLGILYFTLKYLIINP